MRSIHVLNRASIVIVLSIGIFCAKPSFGNERAFTFESFTWMTNDEASIAVTNILSRSFPRGSKVDDVVSFITNAGGSCKDIHKSPPFVYCIYEHPGPEHTREALLVIEWKIIISHGFGRKTVEKIEAYRGTTSL